MIPLLWYWCGPCIQLLHWCCFWWIRRFGSLKFNQILLYESSRFVLHVLVRHWCSWFYGYFIIKCIQYTLNIKMKYMIPTNWRTQCTSTRRQIWRAFSFLVAASREPLLSKKLSGITLLFLFSQADSIFTTDNFQLLSLVTNCFWKSLMTFANAMLYPMKRYRAFISKSRFYTRPVLLVKPYTLHCDLSLLRVLLDNRQFFRHLAH